MLVLMHTALWIILAISVVIGYTRQSSKRIIQSMIYSRFFYFIVIVSQFVISIRIWGQNDFMIIFNAILCLLTICLIEIGYLQKVTMRMRPFLMVTICFTIMINVISQQLMIQ